MKKSLARSRFGLTPPGLDWLPAAIVVLLIIDDLSDSTKTMHHRLAERNEKMRAVVTGEYADAGGNVYVGGTVMGHEIVHTPYVPFKDLVFPDGMRVGGSPVYQTQDEALDRLGAFLTAAYAAETAVKAVQVVNFSDAEDTSGGVGKARVARIRDFYAAYPQVKTTLIAPDDRYDREGAEILLAPGSPPPVVLSDKIEAFDVILQVMVDVLRNMSRKVSTKR